MKTIFLEYVSEVAGGDEEAKEGWRPRRPALACTTARTPSLLEGRFLSPVAKGDTLVRAASSREEVLALRVRVNFLHSLLAIAFAVVLNSTHRLGHGSGGAAYATDALWDWLFQQRRKTP